ncbi:MAG: TonB family protein [Ramlibacter sp.]|nr:TonB family protein [Ramlibacter sp.]
MDTCSIGAPAHKACRAWALIAGLAIATGGFLAGSPAFGQAGPPMAAAAAGDAPSEALRRQALSPYRFILQHANAPARAKPAPAPEAKAEPKRPAAPAPVEHAAVQPRAVPPAPAPAAQPQPAAEPVAALAPKAVEPVPIAAIRREIIPVRTDEPRLPMALLRERPSGVVKVSFEVNPDGSTGAVKVVTSTNRSLNKASVEAVSGWKFQPVDEVMLVETELAYKYD